MDKEIPVSARELAQRIWVLCKDFSKEFSESFMPEIKKSGFEINEENALDIRRGILVMNFWIISEALSAEKSLVDEVHNVWVDYSKNVMKSVTNDEAEIREFMLKDRNYLIERYEKYHNAMKKSDGDVTAALSMTILEHVFNKGNPDHRFVDAKLFIPVGIHIYSVLTRVSLYRKGFVIIENN